MVLRAALFVLMSLGLLGFGTVTYISTRPATVNTPVVQVVAKTTVLSTAHNIGAGSLLKPEDVVAKEVDSNTVPEGATLDTPDARGMLIGAMVRRSLAASEVILPVDVMRPGEHGFLAAVLGPGMRAVTVSVDAVSGTAGLIWPGDRIDLILLQSRADSTLPAGKRVGAETVLSNVRVIAIDQHLVQGAAPDGNPATRTATLEVTPEQAERVSVAAHIGKLSLTVRSADPGPGGLSTAARTGTSSNGSAVTWASDVSPSLNPSVETSEKTVVHVYQGAGNGGEEFKF